MIMGTCAYRKLGQAQVERFLVLPATTVLSLKGWELPREVLVTELVYVIAVDRVRIFRYKAEGCLKHWSSLYILLMEPAAVPRSSSNNWACLNYRRPISLSVTVSSCIGIQFKLLMEELMHNQLVNWFIHRCLCSMGGPWQFKLCKRLN